MQSTGFSIAEIIGMFEREELVVNKTYQRNPGLWPANAKSYFIDTILTEFSFPKVYFHESYDRKLKKIRREIVDGQQRLTTIWDFAHDKFALTSSSAQYQKLKFSDLEEEVQARFMSYPVPVDNILSATPGEILEMFRRMNALTVSLNPAEKRHAEFGGAFKWFINELADAHSPLFVEYNVLTQKQVLRMGDTELLTELTQVLTDGIVNKQDASLKSMYKRFDKEFEDEVLFRAMMNDLFDFISQNLSSLRDTFLFKSYVFHSLCTALLYNKHYPQALRSEHIKLLPLGRYWSGPEICISRLQALASAHESQDTNGPYSDYVKACLSTTHRVAQRAQRTNWILKALNGSLDV